MSMIDNLGTGWFNQRFADAVFLYNNAVHRLVRARDNGVVCLRLQDDQEVTVPREWFVSFSNFAYPKLGWRKLNGLAVYLSRTQHQKRGLHARCIQLAQSAATVALRRDCPQVRAAAIHQEHVTDKLLIKMFQPEWDSGKDIPALLRGDVPMLVINEDVIIELDVLTDNDRYNIYMGQAIVGHMSPDGVRTYINNDPAIKAFIEGVL